MRRTWKVLVPDPSQVEKLCRDAGVSQLLAWLLVNRNVNTPEEVQKFLNPRIEEMTDGVDLSIFDPAAKMLAAGLARGKKFGVHGDYDVDGITATALLVDFFRAINAPIVHFLPHRQQDGYGLSKAGIEELVKQGVNFIIAVDCGISDLEPVARAKELGAEVLVIDHHRPPAKLPDADLIIDPHLNESATYLQELCSAGLVFFLLLVLRRRLREQGFFKNLPEPNLRRSLDLVALGTVADVAPASGINRILLCYGLKQIEQTARFGLRVLKKRAGCDEREIGYGSVAFFLAPRLNAAGRIDEPDPGFELLLEQDPKRANDLADELERRNRLRQRLEEEMMREAVAQVESAPDFRKRKSIVVAGRDWHPGVIGIVAQRLREKYFRPAFAISLSGGSGRGSGRGMNGLDLYQALLSCQDHLIEFGGHKLACGLSLNESSLEPFRSAFEKAVNELAAKDAFEAVMICDAELPLPRITAQVTDDISKLKPFGPGNYEPVLVAKSVLVLDCQPRKESHLWFLLREKDTTMQAMFFRAGIEPVKAGSFIDIAYTIERSIWRNEQQTRLTLRDLKVLGS